MNDFDALLARVVEQVRAIGIPCSKTIIPQVLVNRRAVSRFGCGRYLPDGRCLIELTDRLLEAEERACMQTLAHEVLHTCRGCRNHGKRWQSYAARMNEAYGYSIARTGTCAELGVPDARPARYVLVCRSCGHTFSRTRASSLVLHPERYRCRCGGGLDRVR